MAKKLDQIVVVDIESTCWEEDIPIGMQSEIIEIGICLLNVHTGEITEKESVFVKPQQSTVSEFCTYLTTITPEQLQQHGITFIEACAYINKKYQTKLRTWASFGAYDLAQFQKQCLANQVSYPFSTSHINVKTLFALQQKLLHEQGMAGALQMLNIPLEGTHHRGIDDANNIAKILKKLLHL